MNTEFEALTAAMVAGIDVRGDVAGVMRGMPLMLLGPDREQAYREHDLRLEERRRERARIARELHDTLFQGFLGVSMLLRAAVEQTPSDSPHKHSLTHALDVMHRVIDEGRVVLQGLRSSAAPRPCLEKALCGLQEELLFDSKAQFRIFVTGKEKTSNPELREQVYFIAREAVANAVRHSGATAIEIEVEYTSRRLRVTVRDNGCGMDQQVIRSGRSSHWGLLGMRERAESVGGQFRIWSKAGAGTEIETCVPLETTIPN
jgi:signal transduction histidine kinase